MTSNLYVILHPRLSISCSFGLALIMNCLQHIKGRKHRKFAQDDSNFLQLDFLLGRIRRRTVQEVEDEKRAWEERRQRSESGNSDSGEDDADADRFLSQSPQDMDQTVRPWDDGKVIDTDGDVFADPDPDLGG
jgi:regulatory subunit for Cdc7p protein kinase